LRRQRARLFPSNDTAGAIRYSLRQREQTHPFLGDGRLCLASHRAERALWGIATGLDRVIDDPGFAAASDIVNHSPLSSAERWHECRAPAVS